MSLKEVKITEEVWLTCVTHSLSTETEEIMGLLLGDIEYSKNGSATALIWGASPQSRSDRRKDRVETTPEQLADASSQAERMTAATGRTTRVIGWYHSHPHITVFPSHVDMRTQGMYQLLDSGFIGLIFSCFSEDANKIGRIQVIAFQSMKRNNASRPVSVLPIDVDLLSENDSQSSCSEDVSVVSKPTMKERMESDYVASRKTSGSSKSAVRSSELADLLSMNDGDEIWKDNSVEILDSDSLDMSEGMQEAMHRSTLDISVAEYVRKEVKLSILPASGICKLDSPLASFIDLQRVIFEEEQNAYNEAIDQNQRDGKLHPLTFIHHTATYQASMCKLIEYCLSPVLNALQDRVKENEIRLLSLKNERNKLEAEVQKHSDTSSPRSSGSYPRARSLKTFDSRSA